MKNLKRLITVILTCIMSFFMINTVSASTEGSITVAGTTSGKTYEIYKIFDLTYSGSNVAYTIDETWIPFFEEGKEGASYIVDTNTGSLNPITVTNKDGKTQTKYINITEDNKAEFTRLALIYASSLEDNDGEQTASQDTLTFQNLALGYYLVYPEGATDIKNGYSTICSLTSTLPDAEITIKATYPTIKKEVDDKYVEVGQLVTYTITGLVPDTTGYTKYTYQINDTMSEGLLFEETIASLKVTFGDTPITVTTDMITYANNGFTLTFDMTNYQTYKGQEILVTYKAKITEIAVSNDNVKNKASLTYSNDPKDTTSTETTPDIEIPVYTSEIEVTKVDANDTTITLRGAKFVLTKIVLVETNGEETEQTLYYRALNEQGILITNTNTTENVVTVEWTSDINLATILVTEDNGIITFEGIENGTYYLVETESPDGYNLIPAPQEVKVGYNSDGTNLVEDSVTQTAQVTNSTGTKLPTTGGLGTKLFIIIGSLVAIISGVILITNKRISKEF